MKSVFSKRLARLRIEVCTSAALLNHSEAFGEKYSVCSTSRVPFGCVHLVRVRVRVRVKG